MICDENCQFCNIHVILTMVGMVRLSYFQYLVKKTCIVCTLVVDAEILFRAKQTVDVSCESGSAFPDKLLHYALYLQQCLDVSLF